MFFIYERIEVIETKGNRDLIGRPVKQVVYVTKTEFKARSPIGEFQFDSIANRPDGIKMFKPDKLVTGNACRIIQQGDCR